MKIKLKDDKSLINDLNNFDATKAEIHHSKFYWAMQGAERLDASFAGIYLTPEAIILMARIVAKAPMLHTLILDNNDLQNIAEAVEIISSSKTLGKVSLRYNNLGKTKDETNCKIDAETEECETNAISVAKSLAKMNLHTLDLGGNGLASQAPEVVKIISVTNLHSLCLWGNALRKHGIEVAKSLAGMESLRILDLGGNHLGIHAIEVIQSIAEMNLYALYFSGNDLGRFGVPVSEVIAQMTLKMLDLSGNGFKEHTIKVAENISPMGIDTLILNSNGLGSCAPEVARHLSKMEQLKCLSLNNHNMWPKAQETIGILLKLPMISKIDLKCFSTYFIQKYQLYRAEHIVRTHNAPIKALCKTLLDCLSSELPGATIGLVKEYADDSVTCIFNTDWELQG